METISIVPFLEIAKAGMTVVLMIQLWIVWGELRQQRKEAREDMKDMLDRLDRGEEQRLAMFRQISPSGKLDTNTRGLFNTRGSNIDDLRPRN